jgi:nitrite reductase (NADH) large subunit
MKVVIIGAGMAGTRLAELLRVDGHTVELLGDEPYYQRHRLTEYVAGRGAQPEADGLAGDVPPVAAARVLREARVVVDSSGQQHAYDHLVFATGAEPVQPASAEVAQVLRTATDAQRIVDAAATARRVVVLGGGVLGVETACALRERGVAVTLVHDGTRGSGRPPAGRSRGWSAGWASRWCCRHACR